MKPPDPPERIKEASHWTRDRLARASGVSMTAVNRYCDGRSLRPGVRKAIELALAKFDSC